MPRLLPLLCLTASVLAATAARADTLLHFTVYPQESWVADPSGSPYDIPQDPGGYVSFTIPLSPDVPPVSLCSGQFCAFPDNGFTVNNVPLTITDLPFNPPGVTTTHTTASIYFGDDLFEIQAANGYLFGAHDYIPYTLSDTLEPTFTLLAPEGYASTFFSGGINVGVVTVIPESAGSSPVPEPATLTLLATGALGLLTTRGRRHP